MTKIKRISFILIIFVMVFAMVGCHKDEEQDLPEIVQKTTGHEKWNTKIDYSDKNNWLSMPDSVTKDVDVIYYYPTCYQPSESEDDVSDIDDTVMRQAAANCLANQASVFSESCNIYAPYYRQLSATVALTITDEENATLFRYAASKDATDALDYYFENINSNRPFILAGHSQGSETSIYLLADYFKDHPDYLKRMVAAYIIGYSVTDSYLEENKHLSFATKADDYGVIVSWNTEGPNNVNQHNAVVLAGANSINPINWKTDETYASIEENLGSFINGEIVSGVADAQINLTRGTVITKADTKYTMGAMTDIFGTECFHSNDYALYYNNIKANVAARIAAYLSK